MFYLLCEDGNFGEYHGVVIPLYLYLSRVQWERGYHDDAFASLDEALKHGKALEALQDSSNNEPPIVKTLPQDWPWFCSPDYSQVEKEIKADPRWEAWVEKTKH